MVHRAWLAAQLRATVLVAAASSLAVAGLAAAEPKGSVGADLDYYLSVARAAWLVPLRLDQEIITVESSFRLTSTLDDVSLRIRSGEGTCDTSKPMFLLKAQLMLFNGLSLSCDEYNEPGNAPVSPSQAKRRVAAVLGWLASDLRLVTSDAGIVEGLHRYVLAGPHHAGQALFDNARGVLISLELQPVACK